jgi:hypothetical protein
MDWRERFAWARGGPILSGWDCLMALMFMGGGWMDKDTRKEWKELCF